MNIGRQWADRLKIWAQQFPKHYFHMIGSMEMSYFTTMDHLSFADGVNGPYVPAPVGTRWGKKWEYGWFHTRIVIPSELEGKRVVVTLGCGEEMLVWVNGVESGAIDKHHKFITLSRCAKEGDIYDLYAEVYAGHGTRNEGAGPVAHGEESVPEPPQQQVTVKASCYGAWNEELFQVAMDYLTLYSLVQKLPEKSLRTMKIVEGLKKFTYEADFELPEPEMTASCVAADRHLKPLLACKNGSTAPEFTIFGQSHLDMAWLWPVEETVRKSARTYSNQLALMEEYPDFRFLLCEPPILENLKEHYPNVWRRVREKVAEGNFLPEGAMWIESDTNIPSGESLIRQIVWGKRWFRRELGVDSQMAWMPDTFGFTATLPQILKKCQVPYFATQKLVRQDPECQPFPYNIFWWEGMDGSRVLSHLFKKNNAVFQAGDLITRWEEDRIQQDQIDGMLYPFGYGDGGGGPTREMVEMANRCADLEGAPRCRMESPVAYLQRQENVENVFTGELYLAWHRGTLTSQAKTKAGIRWAETALKQTEYLLSRRLLSGGAMPENWQQRLEDLWKTLLFNQFHDIATGASIHRVHQRAEEELERVMKGCAKLESELYKMKLPTFWICNRWSQPLWYHGMEIPAQAGIPLSDLREPTGARVERCAQGWAMENQHLRCVIDEKGYLISVRKAGSDREYLAGIGNRFLMFKDVNTCYDAWEMGSMYEKMPVALDETAEIRVVSDSGIAVLQVKKRLHDSVLEQSIVLYPGDEQLIFVNTLQWQEKHKLLKVAFPVNTHATEAIHEVQFGHIKRPTHRSYQTDRDRYEVCNHRYTALTDGAVGAAVLNDGKYGINVAGNEIRLTLLKSAMMPDQSADRGEQVFTYAFYPFEGTLADSDVLRYAAQINEPMLCAGTVDDLGPIFLPNVKNIVVDTMKPADTIPNALLVRAYEAMGQQTDCAFAAHTHVKTVTETDMLEENGREVDLANVHFGAFEIKTFILHL